MTALRFDPDWQPPRCAHDLVACRPCGTAEPGVHRHGPVGPPPREVNRRPQFLPVVTNRAERRAAMRYRAGVR